MPALKTVEAVGRSRKSWKDAVEEVMRRAYKTIVGIREVEVVRWSAAVDSKGQIEYEARVLVLFELVDELEPHG